MRCRLLLLMIAVAVRKSVSLSASLSVMRLNSAVQAVRVESLGAAFVKSLWPLVMSLSTYRQKMHYAIGAFVCACVCDWPLL